MTGVSVLMTAFNAGEYLRHAVASLKEQTHKEWELILIDNGSRDGSVQTLNFIDQRIHLVRLDDNIGRTPALQMALELATYPYVAILDADDVCRQDRLEVQAGFLDANPRVVLVGSCVDVIDAQSRVTGKLCLQTGHVSHDALAERNIFVNSSLMYRREEARVVGGYDARFEYAQDYHLTLKLAGKGETVNLAEHLVQLRILTSSYTRAPAAQLIRAKDEVSLFEFAAKTLELTPDGTRANRYRRAISQFHLGLCLLRNYEVINGAKCILIGIRTDMRLGWVKYMTRGRRLPTFISQRVEP